MGRLSFYRWKADHAQRGEAGLVNARPIPNRPRNQTQSEIFNKVLYLRGNYLLGSIGIVWHLARFHDFKRGTSQLNGKVERSHRADQLELPRFLPHKGDVDLEDKLSKRENFCKFDRPLGAFKGKTPYAVLRDRK